MAFGIATGRIWNSWRWRCRRSQKEYIWCFYKECFLGSHWQLFFRPSDWRTAISWNWPIRKKLKKSRKEFYNNAWVLCTMVWVSEAFIRDSRIMSNGRWLIYNYSFRHCKKFAPVYSEVAKALKEMNPESPIRVAKVWLIINDSHKIVFRSLCRIGASRL